MKENSRPPKSYNTKFEYFDVTADAGYWAYGSTLEEAFENAARAMFEVMTDTTQIKAQEERKIEVSSEDKVSLLYDFLEELLFLHDVEFLVFSDFKVDIKKSKDNYILKGVLKGDKFDPKVHESRDEVKAVTFHKMVVIEEKEYKVRVILDL